jgi:GT2 family glycosyltransferase
MKILVIIVTYNAMQWVERCFNSLRKSTIVPDVFVADNGSTDGTQAYIQEHYPEVMFHQSDENLGFGKANNLGLQYALDHKYDYVYLLNQDAWIFPETLERLIEISKKHPEYCILSPFQMNGDLYHIDKSFMGNVCSPAFNPDFINDLYGNRCKDVYSVKSVMAAHWFMPRETILQIGGFSPSFPHYGEDDNFQSRVKFHSMEIGAVPSLRVVHDRGTRERTATQKMYLDYTRSISLLSDPLGRSLYSISNTMYIAFRDMIKYRALKPLKYWLSLMFNIREILRNRQISMDKECAFLQLNK